MKTAQERKLSPHSCSYAPNSWPVPCTCLKVFMHMQTKISMLYGRHLQNTSMPCIVTVSCFTCSVYRTRLQQWIRKSSSLLLLALHVLHRDKTQLTRSPLHMCRRSVFHNSELAYLELIRCIGMRHDSKWYFPRCLHNHPFTNHLLSSSVLSASVSVVDLCMLWLLVCFKSGDTNSCQG